MSVDMTKWQEIAKANIHNRPAGQGRLAGKITIVTGAAQGFGKGIAEELYKEGATIIVADMNLPLAETVAAEMGERAWAIGVNVSDNEILWLSGKEDYDEGIAWLRERYDIPLIFLTLGKDGSRAYCGDVRTEQPGFKMNTIETTGAGDTFFGSVLHHILTKGFRPYSKEELDEMLRFANAAAALVTTRRGALRVMPSHDDVIKVLSST